MLVSSWTLFMDSPCLTNASRSRCGCAQKLCLPIRRVRAGGDRDGGTGWGGGGGGGFKNDPQSWLHSHLRVVVPAALDARATLVRVGCNRMRKTQPYAESPGNSHRRGRVMCVSSGEQKKIQFPLARAVCTMFNGNYYYFLRVLWVELG